MKKKHFVGLDASLNSSGLTVIDNEGDFLFYSVYRTENDVKFKKQPHIQLMIDEGDVIFKPVKKTGKVIHIHEETDKKGKKKIIKTLDYSATEVNKVLSNLDLSKEISNIIENYSCVAMEGISYGSKGSSLIDIAMSASLIRGTILQIIEDDKFSVYAPSEIKKFATGSGAANKADMLNAFIKEDVKLAKLVKNNWNIFHNKKGEILSPLTDIVDSFFIAKMLKEKYTDYFI